MENSIKEYRIMLEYSIKKTKERLEQERQQLIDSLSNPIYASGRAKDAENISILTMKLEVLQDQLDTFNSLFS